MDLEDYNQNMRSTLEMQYIILSLEMSEKYPFLTNEDVRQLVCEASDYAIKKVFDYTE